MLQRKHVLPFFFLRVQTTGGRGGARGTQTDNGNAFWRPFHRTPDQEWRGTHLKQVPKWYRCSSRTGSLADFGVRLARSPPRSRAFSWRAARRAMLGMEHRGRHCRLPPASIASQLQQQLQQLQQLQRRHGTHTTKSNLIKRMGI